jgi:4-amino-4-deoxy-L-arabinose transferase-like glycosyltransferase
MKASRARKPKLKLETRKQKSEIGKQDLRFLISAFCFLVFFVLLHYPLLRLPYYWDEAGYYIPAALEFLRSWRLIPINTLLTGHTPFVNIYLALVWRPFGASPLVTRAAMIALAAGTLAGVYALGRRVANREIACWSVLLLALSPLFFAQSTLAHLDLAAGLFTLLALLALFDDHPVGFALASTAAVLSKETAVVLLPVAWFFSWWQHRRTGTSWVGTWWAAHLAPLAALLAWVGFYNHATGFVTGNGYYLRYNVYATLTPARVLLTFLRRFYETFVGGFNWLLTAGGLAGIFWTGRSKPPVMAATGVIPAKAGILLPNTGTVANPAPAVIHATPVIPAKAGIHPFYVLGGGLIAAYLLMLSVVGGAVLPRYLLPIFPPLVLIAVVLVWRLPRQVARSIMIVTAGCFVWAWFLNPPYPFPFEDNLAYADFICLHQRAAQFLEAQAGKQRILSAWPATDELVHPFLGYVQQPLNVVPVRDFGRHDFDNAPPGSFDCLYLYSRHWEPSNNWLRRFPWLQRLQQRYFEYQPQIPEVELATRYHLRLRASFERRGQWVRIYTRK